MSMYHSTELHYWLQHALAVRMGPGLQFNTAFSCGQSREDSQTQPVDFAKESPGIQVLPLGIDSAN